MTTDISFFGSDCFTTTGVFLMMVQEFRSKGIALS